MEPKERISQSETLSYQQSGFDSNKYLELQKKGILDRIEKFKNGRLYLEIGGKFLFDPHASRVLPGFEPASKREIFGSLKDIAELIFCVDQRDIVENRQLSNVEEIYADASLRMAKEMEESIGIHPRIVINMCKPEPQPAVENFIKKAKAHNFTTYKRYFIKGYPKDTQKVLSPEGFGKDDDILLEKNLILVTGAASNSGKMSTCLGQIYLDHQRGEKSGYAKFETFPIWNLPLKHPINLAYEAATADIGDYNVIDPFHEKAYGIESVNYNRDVDAFQLLKNLINEFVDKENYMHEYKSPTDMGINKAGFAITNDEIISVASLREIGRRKEWYQEIIEHGEGEQNWIKTCEELEETAMKYIKEKGYNPNLNI